MRIAATIHAFMVVQGDVHHIRVAAAFPQRLRARIGMLLHAREFLVGQATGLVEDFQRHERLAQVMHQPAETGQAHQPLVQLQLAGQHQHQRRDRHRMQVAVIVMGLQPGHADQGGGVAQDRGRNLLDQRQHGRLSDRPAQPQFREHFLHLRLAGQADVAGACQLGFHRHIAGRKPRTCAWRWHHRIRNQQLFRGLVQSIHIFRVADRLDVLQGIPPGFIDPDAVDAGLGDPAHVFRVRKQETVAQERMTEPGAADFVQIHAGAQARGRNASDGGHRGVSRPRLFSSQIIASALATERSCGYRGCACFFIIDCRYTWRQVAELTASSPAIVGRGKGVYWLAPGHSFGRNQLSGWSVCLAGLTIIDPIHNFA